MSYYILEILNLNIIKRTYLYIILCNLKSLYKILYFILFTLFKF
jgi:hypothetical protein